VSEASNVAYAISALNAEDVSGLVEQEQWARAWNRDQGVDTADPDTELVLESLRADGTITEMPDGARAAPEFRLEPLDVRDLLARDPEPCKSSGSPSYARAVESPT
jgi:hypothetical protein